MEDEAYAMVAQGNSWIFSVLQASVGEDVLYRLHRLSPLAGWRGNLQGLKTSSIRHRIR